VSEKRENTSLLGFLKFFRKLLGVRLYLYIVFNIVVSLLDGLGLAMFIPLIGFATGGMDTTESLGRLNFIPDLFKQMGINLSLSKTLAVIVVIFSLKAILVYLRQLFFIKLRLKALKDIRNNLIDHLDSVNYLYFSKTEPGKIQFNMVGETTRLIQTMTSYIRVLQHIVIVATYLTLAVFTNWQFSILVIIGALSSNIIYKKINSATKKEAKKISGHGNVFNNYLIQALQNFKYLKSTNTFQQYKQKLKASIHSFEYSNFRLGRLNAIAESLREPLIIIIISVMLVFQIKVIHGDVGGILVSLLFFYRGLSHLVQMQNDWNLFLSNSASVAALEGLKNDFAENSEPKQLMTYEYPELNSVELRNISVTLGNRKILNEINCTIDHKATIALVGQSGAGKTTLANVLIGLIPPDSGQILVNGTIIDQSHLTAFRKKIGYITQEPVMFDDTIFNNITLWDTPSTESLERFYECLHLVHLTTFINELPNKENTKLGTSGIQISGGQKQRVSIARELYRNVDLLVMDEATSALDSETEVIIKDNIEALQGKYMLVIIAHRLSTIKNADKIFIMSQGKIVASGTYSELLSSSSKFKKMIELQEI